jgi:hypothetical protein
MASSENDIFFATSFSGHMDYETGEVEAGFRHRIEGLLVALRDVGGFAVYCSVEAEDWKISQQEPGVSMTNNFANIETRPIFLALVDAVGSDGRGIEVEHAYDRRKRVFVATGPDEKLSWSMSEIVAMRRAEHIPYNEPIELANALRQRVEVVPELAEITINDFLATGFSQRSVDRMWRYLHDYSLKHRDFPLRPNKKGSHMSGSLDEAVEWVRTNTPEVTDYETFRMLTRIRDARLEN